MRHFSFDLETLGVSPQAPIVQLACVEFDLEGRSLREFNERIHFSDSFGEFKCDFSTIQFWIKQNANVRGKVFDPEGATTLLNALSKFNSWIDINQPSQPESKRFWSHATFDPPILMNAYSVSKLPSVPKFREFMDIRTLGLIAGEVVVPPREQFGEHHDALADCKYQASYIAAMLRKVGMK